MNYRKAMSKKEVISIVDGVKRHGENVSVKEDFGGESEFMRHLRVDDQTRSIAGKTYDGKVALVSRKADGNHVKYTSNVITKPSNLVKAMRKGLSFKKLKKVRKHGKSTGKHSKSSRHGKSGTRHSKPGSKHSKSGRKHGISGRKHGKSGRKHGKSGRKHGKSGRKNKSSGKKKRKTQKKGSRK